VTDTATAPTPPTSQRVQIDGQQLDVQVLGRIRRGAPTLVFLHEGLGCIALWREFPRLLAERTGLPALLYSRRGYGRSQGFDEELRPGFMHDEARQVLPALLGRFEVDRPILVGHSDGASIALIYAGDAPGHAHQVSIAPLALIAMAPHLFVEPVTVESIASIAARFEASDLPRRLARYHDDPVRTFGYWTRAWLSPAFLAWNIEAQVAQIRCPVLAIQGHSDEYGTMRQVRRIAELAPQTRVVEIDDCGHSPFIDQPQRVLDETVAFLDANGISATRAAP
jgi:pimeloyl-ACP methyl ester carboxylesterase